MGGKETEDRGRKGCCCQSERTGEGVLRSKEVYWLKIGTKDYPFLPVPFFLKETDFLCLPSPCHNSDSSVLTFV